MSPPRDREEQFIDISLDEAEKPSNEKENESNDSTNTNGCDNCSSKNNHESTASDKWKWFKVRPSSWRRLAQSLTH